MSVPYNVAWHLVIVEINVGKSITSVKGSDDPIILCKGRGTLPLMVNAIQRWPLPDATKIWVSKFMSERWHSRVKHHSWWKNICNYKVHKLTLLVLDTNIFSSVALTTTRSCVIIVWRSRRPHTPFTTGWDDGLGGIWQKRIKEIPNKTGWQINCAIYVTTF